MRCLFWVIVLASGVLPAHAQTHLRIVADGHDYQARRELNVGQTTQTRDSQGRAEGWAAYWRHDAVEVGMERTLDEEHMVASNDRFLTAQTRFSIAWVRGEIPNYYGRSGVIQRVRYRVGKDITRQLTTHRLSLTDIGGNRSAVDIFFRAQLMPAVNLFGGYGFAWDSRHSGVRTRFGVGLGLAPNICLDLSIVGKYSEADDQTGNRLTTGPNLRLMVRY